SEFDGKIELLFEQVRLPRLVSAVLDFTFNFLLRFGSQCAENLPLLFLRDRHAWQPMISQTGLTDRDHAPALCQITQWRHDVFNHTIIDRRMNANYRKDVRIFFGKIDCAPAAFHSSADGDDASNARVGCAT